MKSAISEMPWRSVGLSFQCQNLQSKKSVFLFLCGEELHTEGRGEKDFFPMRSYSALFMDRASDMLAMPRSII